MAMIKCDCGAEFAEYRGTAKQRGATVALWTCQAGHKRQLQVTDGGAVIVVNTHPETGRAVKRNRMIRTYPAFDAWLAERGVSLQAWVDGHIAIGTGAG